MAPKKGPEKATDMLNGQSMSELPGKGFWTVVIDQIEVLLWPEDVGTWRTRTDRGRDG